MSMKQMVEALRARVGNPLRKLVLLKLADQANDSGQCWPSFSHIAEHCEMSRRSVIQHVKALQEAGFLTVENRAGEKGNTSNVYHLHINIAVTRDDEKGKRGGAGDSPPPSAGDSPGSAGRSPGVVHEIHRGSAADSPPPGAGAAPRTNHSSEPLIEPTAQQAFDILWKAFDGRYGEKGSRKEALNSFLKLKPDKVLFDRMVQAVHAQHENRDQAALAGAFRSSFQHVVRWIKNRRWEDEIIPVSAVGCGHSGQGDSGFDRESTVGRNSRAAAERARAIQAELAAAGAGDDYPLDQDG